MMDGRMDGIDVMRLAYLVGDLVQPIESVEQRREMLLEGLADWIGAEAWMWIRWERDGIRGWHRGLSEGVWKVFLAGQPEPPLGVDVLVEALDMGVGLWHAGEGHPSAGVALFRGAEKPAFTAKECSFASVILDEVTWLYRDDPAVAESAEVRLSPRQAAIATLLLQGLGRKDIADRLGISLNTLTSYIREIYRGYGVRSHAAFIKACQTGDLPGPQSSR